MNRVPVPGVRASRGAECWRRLVPRRGTEQTCDAVHVYGVFAGLVLDLEVEGVVEQPQRALWPVGEVVRDFG